MFFMYSLEKNSTSIGMKIKVRLMLQALRDEWKKHQLANGLAQEDLDDSVLTSTELVLDNHNQLVEINRFPGENDVSL